MSHPTSPAPSTPVLLVTGSLGAGKTSTGYEVSNILAERDVPHAFIDLDALTELYPRPDDDRFNTRVMLRNLKAVWGNYADAGARVLVLARVIEDMDELDGYSTAISGAAITVVRLTASTETMVERIRMREAGSALEWHIARTVELAEKLDSKHIGHFVVSNDGRPLRDVAEEILELAQWPPTNPIG